MKTIFTIKLLVISISILSIFSCSKEENIRKRSFERTESRTLTTIGSKSISWLDSLRLDLLENRPKEYSINDAISGIDIILNLYKTQGLGSFIQYDILKKDYIISLTHGGTINTSALRSFFEEVHANNKSQFLNSSLINKALGGITIKVKSQSNTELLVSVSSIIGAKDPNDSISLILDDDFSCSPKI